MRVTLLDVLGQAGRTLKANPLRTALGSLAIAFAVATVAITITALEGVSIYARTTTARTFGSDTYVVARVGVTGQMSRRELAGKLQRNPDVRRTDVRFLDRNSGGKIWYAPTAQRAADAVAGSRRFERASVTGTAAELEQIRDVGLERGRFFSKDEDRRAAPVAVIGADVADALFPTRDPLGQTIRIAGRGFEVVGTLARLGTSGGSSLDRYIWIPLPAFERTFGNASNLQVYARAADSAETSNAEDRTRAAMRARRGLRPGTEDNFDMISPDAARGFVANITQRIGGAAFPISAMAMLAGIVVISNTTLVSVTQRTREIGVRRAIGASRKRVVGEVLTESTLVALIGGAVGLGIVGLAVAVLSRTTAIPFAVAEKTLLIGFAAAAASGVLAGWYPAKRAATIEVVAALRSE